MFFICSLLYIRAYQQNLISNQKMFLSLRLVITAWLASAMAMATEYPPCTTAYKDGVIDFYTMLYNCSANMPSPLNNPSMFTMRPVVILQPLCIRKLLLTI